MKIGELKSKKILILGFGREGRDTLSFLRKLFPQKIIGIADQKELLHDFHGRRNRVKVCFGKNYLKETENYDIIIKSPGIPFKLLPKSDLRKVKTQTEIFFDNCPGQIVGVTGTKGKSTTALLIYQILKKGGVKTHLVGNIGKPVLSSLLRAKKEDIFVYELSSFQLASLNKSPKIAILLNVYPEHLDYHKNFKEYVAAKANIARWQTKNDYLIYNTQNKIVREIAKKSKARKIPIKGRYYKLDQEAAKRAAKIFKIPSSVISQVLRKFQPLPHRLELVGIFRGIKFYNDSLATNQWATIEALDYLGNRVQTLILGGYDRGMDFKKLAKKIKESRIKTLILFPPSGRRIQQSLADAGPQGWKRFFVRNMKEAVQLSYRHTGRGKICLLSPASPSFGLFSDYRERGNLFKFWVRKLKNATMK
jgi:UDP-N-acetylmuramoylalanine--D-glutamate ligase